MLLVFYLDVAKIDLNIAYTYMLQAYEYFQVFHTYICKYFILMLHMFAIVFKCFLSVFVNVSDACFKCFICLFFYVVTDTS
jgi:hypothetical protein